MGIHLTFNELSFSYDTSSSQIFQGLNIDFPIGWTGIVGANGSGKTTLLQLATGDLRPSSGTVLSSGAVLYCQQRTDFPPEAFTSFLEADEAEAFTIGSFLEIEADWAERWTSLSHGERKRAQIAVALWRKPHVLAIDEPTNHIDADARDLLSTALQNFSGIGLLVSHDRELLDSLIRQTLFLEPPEVTLRHGTYSEAHEEIKREISSFKIEREKLDRTHRKLKREAAKRRGEASRSHSRRSKRNLAIKDHDARFKKNEARFSGKDGKAGQLMNQLQGRLKQVELERNSIRIRREFNLGICFEAAICPKRQILHREAGEILVGSVRSLKYPDLTINRGDRIALTGPNGGGKSTLVRQLLKDATLPVEHLLYLPQEIPVEESSQLLAKIRQTGRKELGHIMQIVSRLGSRPERLLESNSPSPGEIRKVLIALGIATGPWLIVMDEPTNHLDLPSIECLEGALDDCPCALLLVSHDERFLKRLTCIRWAITSKEAPVLHKV